MKLSKAKLLRFSVVPALIVLATNVFAQRTLIPFRLEDKWGVMNFFEEFIVEPKYEEVHFFAEELTLYDTFPSLARVRYEGLYGFIDQFGEEVIPPVYQDAGDFNAGYARVTKGETTFVINTLGQTVADTCYTPAVYAATVSAPPSELVPLNDRGEWPTKLIEMSADAVFTVVDDPSYRIFKKDRRYGIERYGKLRVPPAYDSIQMYAGDNALLFLNGKVMLYQAATGAMDTVAVPRYDEIVVQRSLRTGTMHLLYRQGGRWGYRNRKGKINFRYRSMKLCRERPFLYAVITQNGLPGYVNPSLDLEFFSDGPLLTIPEMQLAFAEAEAYANRYIEDLLTESGVALDQLTSRIEACMASVMNEDSLDQATLYQNFALSRRTNFRQIDTLLFAEAADLYLASGLITEDTPSASPLLISASRHLSEKFGDLMETYPKYTFAKMIPSFANKVVNEISPSIIRSGLRPVLETCDFSIPVYRKIVLLHHFHFLAYSHLADRGKLTPAFKKR